MSKRNIFAIAMLGAALFAGTAAADGKTKRIYNPGPAPLNISCPTGFARTTDGKCVQINTTRNCSNGFVRNSKGQCVRTTPPRQTTCPTGFAKQANGQCIRLTQTRPPVTPRPPVRPRPPVAPRPPVQQASFDLSGFNGGVGAGVNGGYYGGGGFVAVAPTRSFSGVLDSAASVFTFNRRVQNRNRPNNPKPRPPHNPCMMGCGGGGGMGGMGGGKGD